MTDHVRLGTEILALDFDTLLCPACRAKIEAAKAAQRALQQLNNLVMDKPSAAPPEPQIPGAQLSRGERLERARQLLATNPKPAPAPLPKAAVVTSNGTILAEPWRHGPKKQISKRAERDIEKVVMGTMNMAQWSKKHGLSVALLKARLDLRARELGKPTQTHVPPKTYVGTKGKLTEAALERVFSGEVTPRKLALDLGIPVGSIYRHLKSARKARARAQHKDLGLNSRGKPRTRRSPNEVRLTDEELQGIYDGTHTQAQIAARYGVAPSLISRRYVEWMARRGLPEKKRTPGPGTIVISDEDLRRAALREVPHDELAQKYKCSIASISYKAKEYALRHGLTPSGPPKQAKPEPEEPLLARLAQVIPS